MKRQRDAGVFFCLRSKQLLNVPAINIVNYLLLQLVWLRFKLCNFTFPQFI